MLLCQKGRALEIKAYGLTDKGNDRPENEDSFFMSNKLCIVADGMGGHMKGKEASEMATNIIAQCFESVEKKSEEVSDWREFMVASFLAANADIYEETKDCSD